MNVWKRIRRKGRPRVITAAQAGIRQDGRFGPLGPETRGTVHYTAGPVDRSDKHALEMFRQYARHHANLGWGTIGYHYGVTRKGTIVGLRTTLHKGTHTANTNSNNVGVVFHGSTGDRPSRAQRRAFRWLVRHAHTRKMPRTHRTDRNLRNAAWKGHRQWPGQATACPGQFLDLLEEVR